MGDDAKILGEEKVAKYREAFSLFDKKNDGTVPTSDLGTLMRAMGSNPTQAQLADMVNEIDARGSGFFTFPEFLHVMTRKFKPPHSEEEVISAFRVLDKSGSGSISADELSKILSSLGEPLSAGELEEFRKIAGGGSINYAEFVKKILANK